MGLLNEDISRIKEIMGLINEGEAQFDSSEKKIIDDFVKFVQKELKIDNDIEIKLQNDKDGIDTTAAYKYEDGEDKKIENSEIRVFASGRALVDILRSIAHELVHHKQNEDGDLEGKHSNVGGPIEDEANSVAGEMVKKFGLNNSEIYGDKKEEMGEQEDGGEPAPSGPAMDTWETGLTRGKANSIDTTSKWESGLTRGKGNPVW